MSVAWVQTYLYACMYTCLYARLCTCLSTLPQGQGHVQNGAPECSIDIYTEMCAGKCQDMCIDMCADACADVQIGMGIDMCAIFFTFYFGQVPQRVHAVRCRR